ncbi:hypothetical protein SLS56_002134 [Neofusicoccum ribis]|uniref:NB-ARC domain-containing protein n=1 Tax=Neofusicoccum ribis TaxID=45134 RepID=A0ABR3T5U8_9PEZI
MYLIPYRRNPNFVDRGSVLSQVEQKLLDPAARVALTGLGGIGKSQLAIEYCYRTRDASPETYVFWVHASNEARFAESYKEIAMRLKLPVRQDNSGDEILQMVKNWLVDEENGRWVLVVDNADDPNVFFHPNTAASMESDNVRKAGKSLAYFLPQYMNGKIVLTSRYKEVALRLIDGPKDILEVKPMLQQEALVLFRKKLDVSQEDESTALEIIEALDYIPLAIDQASAFIAQRTPQMSMSKYLQDFRSSEAAASALLSHDIFSSATTGDGMWV